MPSSDRLSHIADADIVRMAQLGSLEACDVLVRRFRGAAIMVARQIVRSEQTAEDVAQDALIRAMQGLHRLQDAERFPAWLYSITRHRAQYVSIREARSIATDDGELQLLQEQTPGGRDDEPLEILLMRERQDAVRTVLRDLTPEVQRVLFLFYYEQWTAVQIASFLSLPPTTIKWRLHAGRKQISSRITELLEEVQDVGFGCEQRSGKAAPPVVEDGRAGGARGADRKLRKRSAELHNPIQYNCTTA